MEKLETGVRTTLPRATPESVGIASQAVIDYLEEIRRQDIPLHSFMLLRRGAVVAEGWWAPYRAEYPHLLFSLSKSFASTAIGIAASEGLLTLDDRVVDWFPEDLPADVSANLMEMRIRHLLMMGTGHEQDTTDGLWADKDGNWPRAFLAAPVQRKPGTHFVYNSGATYMLSAILRKATGVSLLDYLGPRLFAQLGIECATWETDPRGIAIGGWGLSLRTEDIAKFGQLFLQRGVWEGKQLLPEGWVEEASANQIANGDNPDNDWNQGYGYQFWRCRHGAYRGDGAFGQYCIVMPEQDVVVAMTAGMNDMHRPMSAVWTHLLPAMKDEALPPDGAAHQALERQLRDLQIAPPAGHRRSPLESSIGGVEYQLERNPLGVKSFRIDFAEDEATLVTVNPYGRQTLPHGRETWKPSVATLNGNRLTPQNTVPQRMVCSMTWRDETTLVLSQCAVETPFTYTIECRVDGEDLLIEINPNVSFGQPKGAPIRGKRAVTS